MTMKGKPSALYIRSTPMASKESTNEREYYRQSFDSTYHPIIYELIRELQQQAESFQIAVDPVYDRFLRDVHCTVTSPETDCKKRKSNDTFFNCAQLKKKEKRFAQITIMTAGNQKCSGFSNIPHEDDDFMPSKFLPQCFEVIKRYTMQLISHRTKSGIMMMRHLKNRFERKKQFPIYTTCGYAVFKNAQEEMEYYAYFIYNSLQIGISLTKWTQMYHTFDASFTKHQTSVPICVDEQYVYFNHPSFFIFAWGNGKSSRRLWLEERGYNIRNTRVSRSDFERYFGLFNTTEQQHVVDNAWV